MENNDIIKALEYCVEQGITSECEKCKLKKGCRTEMIDMALDLINRQKAEIEELNIELRAMRNAANSYKLHYETARAEAIKDFAERVKEKSLAMVWSPELFSTADYIECIDSLVKETVGEQ